MAGAAGEGTLAARALAAFSAGCDLVLACTAEGADALLEELRYTVPERAARRLAGLCGTPISDRHGLDAAEYARAQHIVIAAQA